MRDEDLRNLPKQIEGWRIREMLDGLGVTYTEVRRMVIEPQSVEIEVYATHADGRKILEELDIEVLDLSGEHETVKAPGDPKLHRIVIPIKQIWEKPA